MAGLSGLSKLYGAGVRVRNAAYDRRMLPIQAPDCAVISVGNLTVGGSGKTPCVAWLAARLQGWGKHVGILSRGYGGSRADYFVRFHHQLEISRFDGSPVEEPADEPRLLARQLEGVPIVVAADRAAGAELAIGRFGCDTLILDDGFQHRRVSRNCDIVIVPAEMPLGGNALLPRGPMREPIRSLRRADIVMLAHSDTAIDKISVWREHVRLLNPKALFVSAAHEPTEIIAVPDGEKHCTTALAKRRVLALSSIGDPKGFEATLQKLRAAVAAHMDFPDHHPYGAKDWDAVRERVLRLRPDAVVTTEKDWMRLEPFVVQAGYFPFPLWVLRVRWRILSGEEKLDARLAGL